MQEPQEIETDDAMGISIMDDYTPSDNAEVSDSDLQPTHDFAPDPEPVIHHATTDGTEMPVSQITEHKKGRKSVFKELVEFIIDLGIILIIVMIIRGYVAAPFQISGGSMDESYHDKEFIIVNKFSYASLLDKYFVGHPQRGDVVIFRPHASNGKEYYIKRVIGLPGDTLKFHGGEVSLKVNGKKDFVKLNEGYLSELNKKQTFLPPNVKQDEFTVPEGEYFLMGDNRNNSSDSRSCFMQCTNENSSHYIKRSDIVGKVFLDFGYFNLLSVDPETKEIDGVGKLEWISKPRLLDTPKSWEYKELK